MAENLQYLQLMFHSPAFLHQADRLENNSLLIQLLLVLRDIEWFSALQPQTPLILTNNDCDPELVVFNNHKLFHQDQIRSYSHKDLQIKPLVVV
ncbi:hypothetical protein MACK_003699 [Theileria orientalis]|uniref:Uncharacterized protein n=1 Tax=Theileria orientalis TaxID=68886 RepID=A0A976SIV8_THEOR|nr:hypothetical protein MACK_003699 [Theileria orientalis]